jgi:hypothetical protein
MMDIENVPIESMKQGNCPEFFCRAQTTDNISDIKQDDIIIPCIQERVGVRKVDISSDPSTQFPRDSVIEVDDSPALI